MVQETFKHFKPIGATGKGINILRENGITEEPGVITGDQVGNFITTFIDAVAAQRHWNRNV